MIGQRHSIKMERAGPVPVRCGPDSGSDCHEPRTERLQRLFVVRSDVSPSLYPARLPTSAQSAQSAESRAGHVTVPFEAARHSASFPPFGCSSECPCTGHRDRAYTVTGRRPADPNQASCDAARSYQPDMTARSHPAEAGQDTQCANVATGRTDFHTSIIHGQPKAWAQPGLTGSQLRAGGPNRFRPHRPGPCGEGGGAESGRQLRRHVRPDLGRGRGCVWGTRQRRRSVRRRSVGALPTCATPASAAAPPDGSLRPRRRRSRRVRPLLLFLLLLLPPLLRPAREQVCPHRVARPAPLGQRRKTGCCRGRQLGSDGRGRA